MKTDVELGKPVYNRKGKGTHKNYFKGKTKDIFTPTVSTSPKKTANRSHFTLEYTTN